MVVTVIEVMDQEGDRNHRSGRRGPLRVVDETTVEMTTEVIESRLPERTRDGKILISPSRDEVAGGEEDKRRTGGQAA